MCLDEIIESYDEPKEITGYKVMTSNDNGRYYFPYYNYEYAALGMTFVDCCSRNVYFDDPNYMSYPDKESSYMSGYHVFKDLESAKGYLKVLVLNRSRKCCKILRVSGKAYLKGKQIVFSGYNEASYLPAEVYVCSEITFEEELT